MFFVPLSMADIELVRVLHICSFWQAASEEVRGVSGPVWLPHGTSVNGAASRSPIPSGSSRVSPPSHPALTPPPPPPPLPVPPPPPPARPASPPPPPPP